MYISSVLLFSIISTHSVLSLNILGIFNHHGKSHFTVHKTLLKQLSKKGHNLTVISHFPEEFPQESCHHISLAGTVTTPVEGTIAVSDFNYGSVLWAGYYLAVAGVNNCKQMLANQQVQELIKQKPKFDVILLEQFNSDCALGVAHKIGGPVVGTTSHVPLTHVNDRFGIPYNPSYVSFRYLGGGTHPTLLQRLERLFFEAYFRITFWVSQKFDAYTLAKYFDDIPPLNELGSKIKILLAYQSFPFTGSTLLPANVREVGGYHVNQAQPLKGELKKFVDEAEHGVIYISLGSITNTSTFAKDKLEAIIEIIEDLPQRFIVKWDKSKIADKHNKVYVDNWFPQCDIIGHPKTVAFLSHGGMGGLIEAVHFGVPTIAMPLFGDQPSNAAAVEESGFGTQIQYSDLTKENLMAAFRKVLGPEIRDKAKKISAACKDRPNTALDEAVFWVEFAARNPTLSFRTRAADVPFYQYLFLDIMWIFLLTIFLIFLITRLTRRRKQKMAKRNSKNIKQSKFE